MKASDLLDNPKNWRRHPDEQVGAMTSMMDRIGVADASIGVVKADGKIELLDGHLRKSIAADQIVPVLIVDLNEDEQRVFLASFDKLAELALGDPQALHDLLHEFQFDEDSFFRKMMSDVEAELAIEVKQSGVAQKDVEGMALGPHEHYDFLVVLAQTTHEWNVLCDRLGLKPEARRKGMGTARAIRAARILEKLNQSREFPTTPSSCRAVNGRSTWRRSAGFCPPPRSALTSARLPTTHRTSRQASSCCTRRWRACNRVKNWMIDNVQPEVLVEIDDDFQGMQSNVGSRRYITDHQEILAIIENSIVCCQDLNLTTFCYSRTQNTTIIHPEVRPIVPTQAV